MALPDYQEVTQGTAIVWGESGGSGVTATMAVNALANGAAWMGAAVDLGANFARRYRVTLRTETGTAPTAGNTDDLHLVTSADNTNWPAKVTGSSASYTLGTSDANLRQAGPPVVSLIATADANTTLEQASVIWEPEGRYVVPIRVNRMGQAYRNQATASNNTSRVILTPLRDVINE